MRRHRNSAFAIAAVASLCLIAAPVASADDDKNCDMTYTLKGWSAVYKTAKGEGTITCKSGETAQVEISVKSGGLTFGKTEIYNGKAEISGVKSIMTSSAPMLRLPPTRASSKKAPSRS